MHDIIDAQNVGNNILRFRKRKNMTQAELAALLCKTRPVITKWESGKSLPDILLLPRLCDALGVSLEELLYERNEPEKSVYDEKNIVIRDKILYSHETWQKTNHEALKETINRVLLTYKTESEIYIAYYFFFEPIKKISSMFKIKTDDVYSYISIINKRIYEELKKDEKSDSNETVSEDEFVKAMSEIENSFFESVILKKIRLNKKEDEKVFTAPLITIIVVFVLSGILSVYVKKDRRQTGSLGNGKTYESSHISEQADIPLDVQSLEIVRNIPNDCITTTQIFSDPNAKDWNYVKILSENKDTSLDSIIYIFNKNKFDYLKLVMDTEGLIKDSENSIETKEILVDKNYLIYIRRFGSK